MKVQTFIINMFTPKSMYFKYNSNSYSIFEHVIHHIRKQKCIFTWIFHILDIKWQQSF